MNKVYDEVVKNTPLTDDYDLQLVNHPEMFFTICENVTNLKYEVEICKGVLSQAYATLDDHIRETSKKKLTETLIKNEIYLNQSYITLNNDLINLKKDHEKWVDLKKVFEHKLQILLHLSSLDSSKNRIKKFQKEN